MRIIPQRQEYTQLQMQKQECLLGTPLPTEKACVLQSQCQSWCKPRPSDSTPRVSIEGENTTGGKWKTKAFSIIQLRFKHAL